MSEKNKKTLQQKINEAKPGDIIIHYVDMNPIVENQPRVTREEIRELSARLRDTSRQILYETKLIRFLESKGVVVEEKEAGSE
jgi:hypothetical protein